MSLLLHLACAAPSLEAGSPTTPDARARTAFDQELEELDLRIQSSSERAERLSDWTAHSAVASLHLQRARLSGDYADYGHAEQALEQAFDLAAPGGGPLIQRAALNASVHRVDRVPPDLDAAWDAVLLDDLDQAQLLHFEARMDIQQGRYAEAMQGLDRSLDLHPAMSTYATRAHLRFWLGDEAGAEADFDRAEALYHGLSAEPLAWLDLHRGIRDLERGRYDQALSHYQDADDHLGGYWLIQEHIAEIYVLTGREEEAEALYRVIVHNTGMPEFCDALAELVPDDEARLLHDQASEATQRRLESWPEASWGHAQDHFLATGQPERALELARLNVALRPYAPAQLQLGVALLEVGEPEAALEAMQPALDAGWANAELYWLSAEAAQELGESEQARLWREQALALNPRVAD